MSTTQNGSNLFQTESTNLDRLNRFVGAQPSQLSHSLCYDNSGVGLK